MRKAFWKWLHRKLEEWWHWVYYNKVAQPAPPIPADRFDDTFDIENWRPVLANPLVWGEPPMWLCTCPMRIAEGDPKVRPVTPACPVHDPAKPIGMYPYYQVKSTDIPGLERHPYIKPPEGV